MANLSRPPSIADDGDYGEAYTGEHLVEEFYDDDDTLWQDIEVEIDDGNLHAVTAVGGNKDKALCEKVLGLMEARGWTYDDDL